MERRPQPWMVRVTHWVNVPLLVILMGSGLEIYAAFPALGPRGAPYGWFPLQDRTPPPWLRLGGWLAGARALHFAFAWPFVVNGLAYWLYLAFSGQWRARCFLPWRDARNALQTLGHYLGIRKQAPTQGFYNGLQRLAYTSATAIALVAVASGLALYKPLQLRRLAACFGGYDGARAVHFAALWMLAAFTLGHVLLVALHPRTLTQMITGGRAVAGAAPRG
jgi:thiosulfate reductase cytochrome b subunit